MSRNDSRLDAGLAILRITTGAVFLAHGGAWSVDAVLARRRAGTLGPGAA